jgi:hypothetical protein
MNENNTFSHGGWGIVIFFILLFWAFCGGGFGGGWGGRAAASGAVQGMEVATLASLMRNESGCNRVSNCEVEKQGLITAAETNYRIIEENRRSTDAISAQLRSQWDAAQGEKIFDLKMNQLAMQNQYNQQLLAKDATIERMTLAANIDARFAALSAEIGSIACKMLKQPELSGVAAVCPNSAVINGLGITHYPMTTTTTTTA